MAFHLWIMGPDGNWRYLGALGAASFDRAMDQNFAPGTQFFAMDA